MSSHWSQKGPESAQNGYVAINYSVGELQEIVAVRSLLSSGVATEIRVSAGASRSEFAAVAGCSASEIAKLEKGDRSPRGGLALRLALLYRDLLAGLAPLSEAN